MHFSGRPLLISTEFAVCRSPLFLYRNLSDLTAPLFSVCIHRCSASVLTILVLLFVWWKNLFKYFSIQCHACVSEWIWIDIYICMYIRILYRCIWRYHSVYQSMYICLMNSIRFYNMNFDEILYSKKITSKYNKKYFHLNYVCK